MTSTHGGAIVVHLRVRPALQALGARLLIPGWLAITIDTTIISWRRLEPDELVHELTHVRQWRRHGPLGYVVRYALSSLEAAAAGGDWYRDNAFEQEARAAAAANGGADPRVRATPRAKRQEAISTPAFHRLADEVERRARGVWATARTERLQGNRAKPPPRPTTVDDVAASHDDGPDEAA